MATLSIRIPDDLLAEIDRHAKAAKVARAAYVRRALELLNTAAAQAEKRRRMQHASARVRTESLRVLAEFEALPDELP
jgi:metal-responsive CopG/Arc/MetJ family transcriptional regulator